MNTKALGKGYNMEIIITLKNVDKQDLKEAIAFANALQEGISEEQKTKPQPKVNSTAEPEPEEQPRDKDMGQSEEKTPITKEVLRKALGELSKAGKTAVVKDIFKRYGATKLSDLSEEKYEDCYMDALKERTK